MPSTIPTPPFQLSPPLMEDHHHLLQPLTTTTISGKENHQETVATLPASSIVVRLVTVFLIGIISIWANYEATKGFEISIINSIPNTLAGRRFNLLYVSNDKATRIVLSTSELATGILYPGTDFHTKKPISHVIVKLTGRNLTHPVVVTPMSKDEYMLEISAMVMETNFEASLVSAVQRGMARVWLSSTEEKGIPRLITDGIVEYITGFSAGGFNNLSKLFSGTELLPESDSSCWKSRNPVAVAQFLNYCEKVKEGFISRLNREMRNQWNESMMDNALGMPAQELCRCYHSSLRFANSESTLRQVS